MASKAMVWVGRVTSALVILMVVAGAAYFFAKPDDVAKQMGALGFDSKSAPIIVYVELACALVYAIPQSAVLGAILMTGYLGGATACHVRVGQPWYAPVIVGVLVWLGLFFRDAKVRALIPFRKAR